MTGKCDHQTKHIDLFSLTKDINYTFIISIIMNTDECEMDKEACSR